jgi:hypothetical protein
MTLRLFDSGTSSLRTFAPLRPGHVGIICAVRLFRLRHTSAISARQWSSTSCDDGSRSATSST